MTIALDAGAFFLRSLRRQPGALVARRDRAIAASVGDSPARRRRLVAASVPYLVADEFLVVPGRAAIEVAEAFETLPRDLLPSGEVAPSDPVARQVIAILVEGLVPWSHHPHEVCCVAQPGHPFCPSDGEMPLVSRANFFSRLVHLRGYSPLPLNPATALVLAELGSAGFSGVGITLGSSRCDVAVVHRGNQIAHAGLERGGAWIDEQVARRSRSWRRDSLGELVLDLETARRRKEAASLDLLLNDDCRLLSGLYQNLIAELVEVLCETLSSNSQVPLLPQPLPIVCGGGPAKAAGFCGLLNKELDGQCFPVALTRARLAADHVYSVARGCLIRAELEQCAAPGERQSPRSIRRAVRSR